MRVLWFASFALCGFATIASAQPVAEPPSDEPPEVSKPSSGYDKGFFIRSDDDRFKLVAGVRVQGRFALENADLGTGDRETDSAFSIARGRLTLKGHAFGPDLEYKLQVEFGKGELALKDLYVDVRVAGSLYARAGQFKRPFSRQQITSSGKLEMVDRSITNSAFDAGRDIGVMVHDRYEKSPEIEWAFGVFNGTGDGASFSGEVDPMTGEVTGDTSNVPDDVQPAFVARAGYNHGGISGYSEADLEGGPLRFGVAGSVLIGLDGDGGDDGRVQGQLDAIAKIEGLSLSGALYSALAQSGADFTDQSHAATGGHVQAGYMVTDRLQPTLRYAVVKPDAMGATHELAAGFSLFRHRHSFKWQSDVALLGNDLGDTVAVRTQLQLSF